MKPEIQYALTQGIESDDDKPLDEILRAAQVDVDDKNSGQHALTLRMWTIGTIFAIVGCGLNTLFTLRSPSPSIAASTAQLLAYPVGRLWDIAVPTRTFAIFGQQISLNPHPFNPKEHCSVYIMVNITFFTRMTADLLVEQKKFFGLDSGWVYQLLMILSLFLIGFAFAGLSRSVLVEPRKIVWPGLLSATALMSVLHSRKTSAENGHDSTTAETECRPASVHPRSRKMPGLSFFCIVFAASFRWYWFPDFIFPALSYFNFVCWIKLDSPVINQVFGVSSGMVLLPLTFDFFDITDNVYNVSRVTSDESFQVDISKYEQYSPIYMPITYALNTFALAITTLASLISWTALEYRGSIMTVLSDISKLNTSSKRSKRQQQPPHGTGDVPAWWYLNCLALGIALAIFSIEYWAIDLRWYGVLLGFAIGGVFFFPVTLLYANANLKLGIEVFCRIIAGFVWECRVLANTWFVGLGYTTIVDGLSFTQDMKLCLYYHVFVVQCAGMIIGTIGQVAIVNWALGNIQGICTSSAINGFTCPFSQTNFSTSIIWGGRS